MSMLCAWGWWLLRGHWRSEPLPPGRGRGGRRPPTSADVIRTALLILGLDPEEFFIPGGPGEIVGVAA